MSRDNCAFETIHTYSRKQAIADGELVDCGSLAREAGFRVPIALSRGAWHLCVALTPAAQCAGNDEVGRLRDVLTMLRHAIRRGARSERVDFQVICVTDSVDPSFISLYAMCGPGDDPSPVITVLLPDED